jgi:RimJ/RimL family protein N-acetyltransferase
MVHTIIKTAAMTSAHIRHGLGDGPGLFLDAGVTPVAVATSAGSNWRERLPVLYGTNIVLRELRVSDAPSLLMLLATEEVARFISPPPTTLAGFETFITWTHHQRCDGHYACFAVVPEGFDAAVGLFQVKALDRDFGNAEWGFAIGSPFWGRGLFPQGAALTAGFAFDRLGTQRLEARVMVENGRGNGALRKIGAVPEGILRGSFLKNGRLRDQILWSILESDWRRRADGLWEPIRCDDVEPVAPASRVAVAH